MVTKIVSKNFVSLRKKIFFVSIFVVAFLVGITAYANWKILGFRDGIVSIQDVPTSSLAAVCIQRPK